MVKRKTQFSSAAVVWPYTPEPSPHLQPSVLGLEDISEDFAMSAEDLPRARPISVATRKDGIPAANGGRPTLDDVLNNKAPPPYTLAAYTAFLSQQHCLETMEFTTEAKRYSAKYDESAANLAGMPLTTDTDEGFELMQDWMRILDVYIKPGAPREINLPAEERDDLIDHPYEPRPPPPEALDAAVKRMYDLMSDSIFIPFCNSLKTVSYAQTYNALSDYREMDQLEPSRLTFDERVTMQRRRPSRRRRSPPTTSAAPFEPTRSPPALNRPNMSSSLSTALGRQSGARLSTHVSHSSAVSESALTDSSGGPESLSAGEQDPIITPPTTPPTMDIGAGPQPGALSVYGPKTQRSESGGWKKMGMKIFGGSKKKTGSSSFSERREEF